MPGKRKRETMLSRPEIEMIRAARRRGLLQREIAERFNITQARVSQITKRPRTQ